MKRIFILMMGFALFTTSLFALELEGQNLEIIHKALDLVLSTNDLESPSERLETLENGRQELLPLCQDATDETKLIFDSILTIARINVEQTQELREAQAEKDNKKKKREENPERKAEIMGLYQRYQDFEQTNPDLSSHFYFHSRECTNSAMVYMTRKEQIRLMTSMLDDYKKIDQINPDYSENLLFLGSAYYMAPGIAGGNKKLGEEKLLHAVETAQCKSELLSALTMYSQVLFEKKQISQSQEYMNRALELAPESKTLNNLKDANAAGYSMFHMDKYNKSLQK